MSKLLKKPQILGFAFLPIIIIAAFAALLTAGGIWYLKNIENKELNTLAIPAPRSTSTATTRSSNSTTLTAGSSTVDISTWKTYHNDKYGFEVRYPVSWYEDECISNSGILIGFGKAQRLFACGTDAPTKEIVGLVTTQKETTLNTAAQEQVSYFKTVSVTNTSLGNNFAIRVAGTPEEPEGGWFGPPPPLGTKVTKVLTYHNGILYTFEYSTEHGSYLNEFDQILSTFKFVPSTSSGQVGPSSANKNEPWPAPLLTYQNGWVDMIPYRECGKTYNFYRSADNIHWEKFASTTYYFFPAGSGSPCPNDFIDSHPPLGAKKVYYRVALLDDNGKEIQWSDIGSVDIPQ